MGHFTRENSGEGEGQMKDTSNWWCNLGVQAKFQILTQAFLFVMLIAAQQWISNQFEKLVLEAAEERARVLADSAINGLNTLMVTKIGKEDVISDKKARALFIEKMGTAESRQGNSNHPWQRR